MASAERLRREPPRFRPVSVLGTERVTPHMIRVVLGGAELAGFVVAEPAASVRLLLPSRSGGELVIPTWNGNEFLLADGRRPIIRTLTPLRCTDATLEVEVVVHDGGVASKWAVQALPGDAVAVSGPGRGYTIDPAAAGLLLAGDETALPAIGQLLEAIPGGVAVAAHVEIAHPDAVQEGGAHVTWHVSAGGVPGDALVAAVKAAPLAEGTHVWAAGEAAAMQRIRRHLFDERGIARSAATVRGYWKR